jgi:predicted DsbA family dithiol-disulfide isomerase
VRIDPLRKNYEIEVRWTAFPLHPETPESGLTLEELFAGQPVDIKKIMSRLKQVAEELGLPLGERRKTYNSRLAQELAKWAESKGKGDPFHESVFRAFLVDHRATVGFQPYEALERFLKTCGVKQRENPD